MTSFVLATLCLNEMEWLPKLWQQHKDWPGLRRWVFVEGADRVYAEANPSMITGDGLSTDGTTEFLKDLEQREGVQRVTHHLVGHFGDGSANGKCEARNAYLTIAEIDKPDFIMVIDADEFYTQDAQCGIAWLASNPNHRHMHSFRFCQRDIWRPPSMFGSTQPLFNQEVVGGYWDIRHTRLWRWLPSMRYHRNHNWPETYDGTLMNRPSTCFDLRRLDPALGFGDRYPECVHMGFASWAANRQAKHLYYIARGEGRGDPRRQMYVDCRAAWERWKPGDQLPYSARIIGYDGPVPECFLNQV